MTTLVPMPSASFAAYRERAVKAYAEDNVASGRWPAEGATQRSQEDFDESLPLGLGTPDNHLFDIVDEARNLVVGMLWFAVVVKHGLRSAFVYDVEVFSPHQRQGHGRAAFQALEARVQALGLGSIGLHVFAQNVGAQALYRSLGFGVTGLNMLKPLPVRSA